MAAVEVTYRDGHGSGIPGLPPRGTVPVFHAYDPAVKTCPAVDGSEVGDVAGHVGGQLVNGPMVRMADGWHRVGTVVVDTRWDGEESVIDVDGRIVAARPSGTQRVTVTLAGLEDEAVSLLSGRVDGVPRHWQDAHPAGRVRTPTGRAPFWECAACGAETADEALFREVGCLT